MTDEEIEQTVLTHIVPTICYCQLKGKAGCKQHRAILDLTRRVAAQARGAMMSEVATAAQKVRGGQPLSLVSDPYARGCIDTANAIEEAVRELKSGGAGVAEEHP